MAIAAHGGGEGMRVAYIGHAYHMRTKSTRFLIDLLERNATVEEWYGEPGRHATSDWAAGFDESRYDLIIVFQLYEAFDRLTGRHPNVVFIPMYDAMQWAGTLYWRPAFSAAKIVCFSWALRQEMMRRGAVHALFQYYPDPGQHMQVQDFDTLRGFLWYRRREITPDVAFRLCRETEFDQFIVHDAPDPGNETDGNWVAPPNIRQLRRTSWSTDGQAYAEGMRNSNVFFAPRPHEGIGMSVLEAMSSGHCVVAPNAPTMNEYISNGTNGLLYAPSRRDRLDFGEARAIGARARESIERGHQRWLSSIPTLLDFLATPIASLRIGTRTSIPVRNSFVPAPAPGPPGHPIVSVVTICRNAAAVLEATMDSVLSQTGCDFEYVVIDCMSTDGSEKIIERRLDGLAASHSVSCDVGSAAMNEAVRLTRGKWTLFLDAGNTFASEDALRRMFARASSADDVVYGHHIVRYDDGSDGLRRAGEFDIAGARLRCGDFTSEWLDGIPGNAATAIRREILDRLRFDAGFGAAVGTEMLFRARANGARFFNCDEIVAVQIADSQSPEACRSRAQQWAAVIRSHGDAAAADRLYAHMVAASVNSGPLSRTARLGSITLRAIVLLDQHLPALARLAERVVRNAAARSSLRRLLRLPSTADAVPRQPADFDKAAASECTRGHAPPDRLPAYTSDAKRHR
jgi:hypothetical protein